MPSITVGICMGSSCFSRGNRDLITALREVLADEKLQEQVALEGYLCTDACDKGPCVTIGDEKRYGLDAHEIVSRVRAVIGAKP